MKSLSYLNKYLLKYKWRLLLGVVFIFLSNYTKVKMPLIVRDAIDQISSNSINSTDTDKLLIALQLSGIYILLAIISGVFLYFTRQTVIKVSRFIEFDLKNEIFKKYQKLDYEFYKKNKTGDLINRISEDVSKVRMYLGPAIMYSVNLIFLTGLVLYNMAQINGKLTLFALIPLPIMSVIIYFVSKKINEQSIQVQKTQSSLSSLVQESFTGIQTIKSFTLEEETTDQFDGKAEQYKKKSLKLVMINALFMPTILMLIGVSTVLTIYVGGLLTHQEVIALKDIVTFVIYVQLLTWPFASIGWVTSIVQRAAASQQRINEFIKEPINMEVFESDSYTTEGNVRFENVSFTYENTGIQALKKVNFEINTGETLGIIGKTGSGKSTIIQLLTRLFDPESGTIYIDEKPLKSIDLGKFRDLIGIVPQDVFLFSDSIKNNINFGVKAEVPLEKTIEAAKNAHVHHNIVEFEKQYETLLGERGVNLSGGQKQRISIARALIKEPKLVAFDDSFSAIDTETEELILGNLKELEKTPTSIIVSHRISTIRHANAIIIIEDGAIIAKGTHDELLNSSEYYQELAEKQS
jgi:ATP-binding cassette subfamily B protein